MAKKSHHKDKYGNAFQSFNLGAGTRYVFFQSLPGKGNLPIYQNALTLGSNLVNQAAAILGTNPLGQYDTTQYGRIEKYITWIQSMAAAESGNEQEFISQTYDKLKSKGKISQELEQNFSSFFEDPSNLLKIQNLINEIMHLKEKDKDIIDKLYDSNMGLLQEKINQIKETDKDLYEEFKQAFNINPGKFNKMANKLIKDEPKFKTSYANLVARKITSAIYNLSHDYAIIEQIRTQYTNKNMSNEKLAQYLIAYITKYISDLDYNTLDATSGKELAEKIGTVLTENTIQFNQIASEYVTTVMNAFTKKKQKTIKSIEQVALTTGKETSRMFLELTTGEQRSFISIKNGYGAYISKKERDFLRDFGNNKVAQTSNKLEQASKIINKAVRDSISKQLGANVRDMTREEIEKRASHLFKIRNLKTGLKNYLQVRISGPDMAEIQGDDEFHNFIVMSINTATPGHSMKYKNDITAHIFFDDISFTNNIHVTMPNATLPLINNIPTNFLEKYQELSHGLTDVAQAKEAYIQTLEQQKNVIEEAYKRKLIDDKEKDVLLQSLANSFFSGISVKDYQYGTNEFGFHGGSLGNNIDNIMNNISEMYELGGISKTDAELLSFAAANCGSDALGSNLKEPLQMYLLGAAATIMFDDGFAASETFLQQMQQRLNGFEGPKTLHLFRLQGGRYVTAAFVYSTIYSNLLSVYKDIQSSIVATQTSLPINYVTINNSVTEEMVNDPKDVPSAMDRWNIISGIAHNNDENIQINFSFLAGLMDIFDAIGEAFKP